MTNSPEPTISVIMPVYNAERYVAEAVESILAQTFTDFEFLIIDDGSTDGSLAILQKYAARDSRVRLKSRPNTGYIVALNEMLADARGEFIARMDADDISVPERFAIQIDFLENHGEAVAIGSKVLLIDEDGDSIREFREGTNYEETERLLLKGDGGSAVCHPTVMMRTERLAAAGGYDESFWPAEDLELFMRLSRCGKVCVLPRVLLRYRLHGESTSMSNRDAQLKAVSRAVLRESEFRGFPIPDASCRQPATPEKNSRTQQHQRWAWWALGAGNVSTARKHARRATLLAPYSSAAWRVLVCSLRGY